MTWYILLSVLAITGYGIAFFMARRIKPNKPIDTIGVEKAIEALAKSLSKEIAVAIKEALADLKIETKPQKNYSQEVSGPSSINIDETLIPTKVNIDNVESNVDNMAKVEKKEDKALAESKNKLAALFNKKGKE